MQDNLRKWWTGGLRRISAREPFLDVIRSTPTRREERALAPHPSLKPQSFMRQVVRAALPLGKGIVLDPFMGAGSTIAAALAVGYESIGVERDPTYFDVAQRAIPVLAKIAVGGASSSNGSTGGNGAASERPKHTYREYGASTSSQSRRGPRAAGRTVIGELPLKDIALKNGKPILAPKTLEA